MRSTPRQIAILFALADRPVLMDVMHGPVVRALIKKGWVITYERSAEWQGPLKETMVKITEKGFIHAKLKALALGYIKP